MTNATAKTIQIYLPTGEPRGIRIAEITTRIVRAILIPRSELAAGKQRIDLDYPGVYFLFGDSEDEAKPSVYIGQTENAKTRFDDHNKKKTFWKTAIFFYSKTQNFTQAHIRWLEWHCLQKVKEVARYTLENGQVPDNSTYVTEPMEAELLDVFETISTLVSTLGYPVFDPVIRGTSSALKFYCNVRGCDATGEMVEDGFVVREGSKCRIEMTPSAPDSVKALRERLLQGDIITEENDIYTFLQDYLFSSPSAAAATVLGASANGWVEWKDKAGRTLSDVYRSEDSDSDTNGSAFEQ